MKLSELSVRRPVLITMVYVIIMVICAMFISNLQISLYPSVSMPVISVMVDCNEAGPEEIEQQVAKVLENNLGSLENLNTISSTSSEGQAFVTLEFNYGTDLDDAEDDVQSEINTLVGRDSFPDWADTPTIFRFDRMNNSSFMRLVMSGSSDLDQLKEIAEDDVSPMLLRVSGVSQVEVMGTGTKKYEVKVDPIKLAAYDLTLTNVKTALANANINDTQGTITQDSMNYTISMDERFMNLDDIRQTVVSTIDGADITVDDIATVESAHSTGQERYLDGNQVINLSVSNDSDANSTTVAKAVRAALPEINASLPDGVKVTIQRDETTLISSTLNEVYANAIEGILLAALFIFLFLRNIKATLIISLSMPISILITLMVMSMADITVNSMSMSGLILGIGMIVDASIIILENTYNYRERGNSPAASAILGSENMTTAIMASTLTTICVFVPLIIFKNKLEMIGIMFQDLIWTVIISLLASMFVAFTLVPALCGSILKLNTRVQKPLKFRLLRWMDNVGIKIEQKLENGYANVLDYFLSHRFLLIMLLVLLVLFSFTYVTGIGMNLTPAMNTDDSVNMSLTLPAGTNNSVTKTELFAMQTKLTETLPEGSYTQIMVNVGTSNTGSISISMPDIEEQKYTANDLKKLIRPLMSGNPDASWTFSGGRGPGNSSPIDVTVTGNDLTKIESATKEIAAIINSYVPEATDVTTDLENGSPRITMTIDKKVANDLGVSMSAINTTVSYALTGTTATTISTFNSDTTYSLVVMMDDTSITSINELGGLLVAGTNGNVRLDTLASFSISSGPSTISRENKKRVNNVTAKLADGYTASEVQAKVESALAEHFTAPDGVVVGNNGDIRQLSNYGPTLVMIVLLALLLVFAVMAGQFESLVDPFIIFATIPLLSIGVIFIHVLMNQSFSLFSVVGIVALIGVVVNNGIVLVDSINQRVRKHEPVRQACLESARTRLRPILMTTLTTVVGMIPLAFFPGSGSEMMQPIALTFVGGLLTGAFLTLFLSPVLYSIINTRREKKYDDPRTLANQLALFDQHRNDPQPVKPADESQDT
ncbi:MAG: efflux RND transporter permease subunit [Sphaerochaeta sp.]|jgi:multidrug efflux pump subunit AcrB|nr:efflux RND transporter permease subunit [Sphaerochaeta sp.]